MFKKVRAEPWHGTFPLVPSRVRRLVVLLVLVVFLVLLALSHVASKQTAK